MTVAVAEEFFRTAQAGQRFKLIDPSGKCLDPAPEDILVVSGWRHDDEAGRVLAFTYETGSPAVALPGGQGFFVPEAQVRHGRRFELLDVLR